MAKIINLPSADAPEGTKDLMINVDQILYAAPLQGTSGANSTIYLGNQTVKVRITISNLIQLCS